jgi:hypothetical protein
MQNETTTWETPVIEELSILDGTHGIAVDDGPDDGYKS